MSGSFAYAIAMFHSAKKLFGLWFLLLGTACIAPAATMLFDFEDAAELKALHDEHKSTLGPGKTVDRAEHFASSGKYALRFATPGWKKGMPQWPAFDADLSLTNWTGYDRLYVDVFNASASPQRFSIFFADTTIPLRKGYSHQVHLPPFSYAPVVVPLAKLTEKKIKLAAMRALHIFTAEPPGDMTLYMDRIMLLKKGEPLPELPASFLRDFAAVQAPKLAALNEDLARVRTHLQQQMTAVPALKNWADHALQPLGKRVGDFKAAIARADASVLDADRSVVSLSGELEHLESLATFRAGFEAVRSTAQIHPAQPDLAVGFATSMEKILPLGLTFNAALTNRVTLSLARNEKESFQVLVTPFGGPVRQVQVRIGDLQGENGQRLVSSNLHAAVMGYVETKSVPPYGSAHVGWWPDPILDFQSTTDIAEGDLQSFWVRVNAPASQAPGVYRGRLEVLTDGKTAFAFDLEVQVYPFRLPDRSPLPMAITFAPEDSPVTDNNQEQKAWRQSPEYPVKAWKPNKLQWADFLAQYYFDFVKINVAFAQKIA
ncbi:MAG: glycoside hydrolase domain-containing protein [Verrucomicrobiota bacterium]